MAEQLLDRLKKAEQRIVDLYAKLAKVQSGTYSREVLVLPVPALDEEVTINITALDTIVVFEGDLVDNFTLYAATGPNLSYGDRIYLFVKGSGNITMGPNLNPVSCGDSEGTIDVQPNMVCHEMVFDGNQFTGIDNC